jgi:hypothetical protein
METKPAPVEPIRYLNVSLRKLLVMSTMTLGLYDLYWFYKNWKAVKVAEKSNLSPVVNAFFLIFTAFPLFKRATRDAKAAGYERPQNPGALALVFIALIICGEISAYGEGLLFSVLWLVSFLSVLPLLDVQRAMSFSLTKLEGAQTPDDSFSGLDMLFIVLGGLLIVFSLFTISWQ